MKYWKQLGLGLVLAVVSMVALAEDTYKLTTGAVGGTYHDVLGVNLRNVLREHSMAVDVLPSRGSVENLNRIADSNADIGFTQADALAGWLRQRPAAEIEILGSLGQECLYLVVHKDSDIKRIRDLDSGEYKVAVGEQGSGSAQSWDFLRTLNPTYVEPQVFYQGGVRAMGQVQTGQLDAFLWVTSPTNRSHRFLEAVMIENSPFRFVEFNDKKLASTLPNGQEVYTTQEVTGRENTGFFGGNESIKTLCTDLTVVADYNLDSAALEAVATAVMMNSNRITAK